MRHILNRKPEDLDFSPELRIFLWPPKVRVKKRQQAVDYCRNRSQNNWQVANTGTKSLQTQIWAHPPQQIENTKYCDVIIIIAQDADDWATSGYTFQHRFTNASTVLKQQSSKIYVDTWK